MAHIERTAQFGFVLPKSSPSQLSIVITHFCNRDPPGIRAAPAVHAGPWLQAIETLSEKIVMTLSPAAA
jgi:hypothetical protein